MKFPWKGFAILAILVAAIVYDLPTFLTFMPKDPKAQEAELNLLLSQARQMVDPLQGLEFAIPDPQKNRIELVAGTDFQFPENNKVLEEVLGGNFVYKKEGEGHYLEVKPGAPKDVFVSKVADQLSSMASTIKKIKGINLTADKDGLLLQVGPNQRLSPTLPPLKQLLGDKYDFSLNEETNLYTLRKKEMDYVINLGLDLQGGMYMDIGVQVDEVIKSVVTRTMEGLESALVEEAINYEELVLVEDSKIDLLLQQDEKLDLNKDPYKRLVERDFVITPQPRGYRLELKPEELDRIKKKAVDQALETIRNRIDQLGVKEPSIQRRGEDSIIIQLPGLKDPDQARRVIGQVAVLNFQLVADKGNMDAPGPDQVVLFEEVRDQVTKEVLRRVPYLLEKKVLMQGDMIRDARVGFEQTGTAYVSMSFDDQGKDLFTKITAENVNRRLAIVLDGKVQSAPNIREKISGGEAQITGSFSPEEASELALVLRSGALPAPIMIHEERTVGASLGEDSIREALISLCLGFAAVMAFMAVYYGVSGIFSVLALICNLLITLAALAYFQATLTLPGMAGVVLTIGMAVDANVLIFERIREEIGKGTAIRNAINIGFSKATTTILDSNITTILAAIILFQFGTGPIKGFAVTLSIGIVASMFTAVVLGRFLFELAWLNKRNLKSISI